MTNSSVRSKTSASSWSKPKTKAPRTAIPSEWRRCRASAWSTPARLVFLISRSVSACTDSKPIWSPWHPDRFISRSRPGSLASATVPCPTQRRRSGIISENRARAARGSRARASSTKKRLRSSKEEISASTSPTGRVR